MRKRAIIIFLDHLLLLIGFCITSELYGESFIDALVRSFPFNIGFLILHLLLALAFDKYNFRGAASIKKRLLPIIYTNLVFTVIASVVIIMASPLKFPQAAFFVTMGIFNVLELIMVYTMGHILTVSADAHTYENKNGWFQPPLPDVKLFPRYVGSFRSARGRAIQEIIVSEAGETVFEYLRHLLPLNCQTSAVVSTKKRIDILSFPKRNLKTLINIQRVNDIQYLNKFFEAVNTALPCGGVFVGCGETILFRKKRFHRRFGVLFGTLLYTTDFMFHRVLPKLLITQKLYFGITRGNNRVLSKAEILGRLYSCGFRVRHEDYVDGLFFFVAQKASAPVFDNAPTYGPLIGLRRVGKGGKMIKVYKMRTMHPYAEYLQSYIFEKNNLRDGGKFSDDFRISTVGRIMRMLWIDELPMLINWLKGDLKMVGVRPLSEQYFKLYSPDLQKRRIQFKPGLVPPFYADMPKTLEEIMDSERRYLDAYEKSPFLTDCRYFWKAFVNIVFKNARSA